MTTTRTSQTTRTMTCVVVATVLMVVFLPRPASAGPVLAYFEGTVAWSGGWGTCGTGTLSGRVTGVHSGAPYVTTFSGNFSYCSPDVVTENAAGSLQIGATHPCSFTWRRVGVSVVASITGKQCDTPGHANFTVEPGGRLSGTGVWPTHATIDFPPGTARATR